MKLAPAILTLASAAALGTFVMTKPANPKLVISPAASISVSSLTAPVSWKGATGAVSYALCYGTESKRYLSIVHSDTTNCIANLIAGGTYYFAVTAVDSNNIGSDFSPETVVTMPLGFDLYFPNQPSTLNPQLESSPDLVNWNPRKSDFTNGLWRVSDPKWPMEFYRTTTTK